MWPYWFSGEKAFKNSIKAGADPEIFSRGGGSEPRTLNFNKQKNKAKKGGGGSFGGKTIILCDCLFVPLIHSIVSVHCIVQEGGGGGLGAFPQKNLSKTGSFSRKNTPFDTLRPALHVSKF